MHKTKSEKFTFSTSENTLIIFNPAILANSSGDQLSANKAAKRLGYFDTSSKFTGVLRRFRKE